MFSFLFTVWNCLSDFTHKPFYQRSKSFYKTWLRSQHNASKFHLPSWALNAPSWTEHISTLLLTFWVLCQQSTANCVRAYALREAAQCHKFLTGTIRPLLYWASDPPSHSSDTPHPPCSSPDTAAALFSAFGPNAWHTNYITATEASFLLLHFLSVP